jgi:hypothetical protein
MALGGCGTVGLRRGRERFCGRVAGGVARRCGGGREGCVCAASGEGCACAAVGVAEERVHLPYRGGGLRGPVVVPILACTSWRMIREQGVSGRHRLWERRQDEEVEGYSTCRRRKARSLGDGVDLCELPQFSREKPSGDSRRRLRREDRLGT